MSTEPEFTTPEADNPNLLTPTNDGGASYGHYSFSQTLESVDVYVPVRTGVKSRDIDVKITGTSLRVGVKGETPILDGKLHDKIKLDDCTWTLIDNKLVHVYLEKLDNKKWWSCVLAGEKEIDTKKVVPENSKLSDLDGDIRQTVEKMMFDQRQKAAGLPTSDESAKMKVFEQFKSQHPDMDFSKAKIDFGSSSSGSGNMGL